MKVSNDSLYGPSQNGTSTSYPLSGLYVRTDVFTFIPSTMEETCQKFEFVLCSIVIGILCVLGLAGNSTSFLVLRRHKSESATVFLLQVLAVSDSVLLLCSFLVYSLSSLYPITGGLRYLFDNCFILQTYIWPISLMAHTTTIYITVLVTLNRYCAVCRPSLPLGSYFLQATKLHVVAVISFSILYNTPRFFEHQVMEVIVNNAGDTQNNNTTGSSDVYGNDNPNTGTPHKNVTFINVGDNMIYQIVYSNILYFPVMYVVPLISLTCLNYRLVTELNQIREKKQALTGHRVRDDHITLVIIVIVFVFIVCQTPALINQIFWAVMTHEDRECGHFHFYYTKISDALVVFNSSTNFVIYCLFGKSFRKAFIETICRRSLNARSRTIDDPSMQPLQDL